MSGRYHSYSHYQHSGVDWLGDIPTGWSVARVKQYADVTDGSHHSPAIENAGHPFISVTDIRRDDIDFEDCKRISTADYQRLVREGCKPEPGNLLLTKDGTIGRAVVVRESDPSFVILSSLGLISHLRDLDGSFLRHFLVSGICVDQMNSLIHGSALRRLTIKKINELVLTFPVFPDQAQIAKFLDYQTAKIDTLIEKQKQLIVLLKEKRQGVISHAVTKGLNSDAPMRDSGIEWLGEIPAHWATTALKRLVVDRRPITYGIVQPGEPDPIGKYMIRGGDYSDGWCEPDEVFRVSDAIETPYKRSRMKAGDLVITIVGAGVGNVAVVPDWLDNANITQTSARIALDAKKANTEYVCLALQGIIGQRNLEQNVYGAAQPRLNIAHVDAYVMTVPPLSEQQDIAAFINPKLDRLGELEAKADQVSRILQERRTALISAAVTGKIDVRGWKAPESEAGVA